MFKVSSGGSFCSFLTQPSPVGADSDEASDAPASAGDAVRLSPRAQGAGCTSGAGSTGVVVVKPGDTLWGIARANGVSVGDLRNCNPSLFQQGTDTEGHRRASSGWWIYPGDQVKLPGKAEDESAKCEEKPAQPAEDEPAKAEEKPAQAAPADPDPAPKFETYEVKKGDTLWAIAQDHGLTVDDLKAANPELFKAGEDDQGRPRAADGWWIYPGDQVKIPCKAAKDVDHPAPPAPDPAPSKPEKPTEPCKPEHRKPEHPTQPEEPCKPHWPTWPGIRPLPTERPFPDLGGILDGQGVPEPTDWPQGTSSSPNPGGVCIPGGEPRPGGPRPWHPFPSDPGTPGGTRPSPAEPANPPAATRPTPRPTTPENPTAPSGTRPSSPSSPSAPSSPVTLPGGRHGVFYDYDDLLPMLEAGRSLRIGDQMPGVFNVQRSLVALGYAIPDGFTGYYNFETAKAVESFQQDHGLPATGRVDTATLEAIDAAAPAPFVWGD